MDEVQRLLDAEEATNELLASLEQLKEEMGGYADAKASIEEAVQALRKFVGNSQKIASEMGLSIETLKSLGMAEVLDRTNALRGLLEGLSKSVEDRLDKLSTELHSNSRAAAEELNAQATTSMTKLRKAVESQLREAHAQSLSVVENLGQQSREQSGEALATVQKRLDGMQEGVKKLLTSALDSASDAQSTRLTEFGSQQRESLNEIAKATRTDVVTHVTTIGTGQDATQRAISRLGKIILAQSIFVALLVITVAALVITKFTAR